MYFLRCSLSSCETTCRKFDEEVWFCWGNWEWLDSELELMLVDSAKMGRSIGVDCSMLVAIEFVWFDEVVALAIRNCLCASSNDRRKSSFHLGASVFTIVAGVSSISSWSINICSSSIEKPFIVEFGPPLSELLSSSRINWLGNNLKYSFSMLVQFTLRPLL